MAIVRDRAKYLPEMDSGNSAVDLSGRQFTFVAMGGPAVGSMTFTTPSGQGVNCYGVQHNIPAAAVGSRVEVAFHGIEEVIANEALNAGVEVAVAGTNGRAGAAASGDWVLAYTREGASASGHRISVRLIDPYIKP